MDKLRQSKLTDPIIAGLNCIELNALTDYFSGLNIGELRIAGITKLGDLFVESETDGFVSKIKNYQQFKEITGSTNILKVKYLDDMPLIDFEMNRPFDLICTYCGFKEKTVDYLLSHNINTFSGFVIFMTNINNPEYNDIPKSVKGELLEKYKTINDYYVNHNHDNVNDLQATYDRLVEKKQNEINQLEQLKEPMTYGPK